MDGRIGDNECHVAGGHREFRQSVNILFVEWIAFGIVIRQFDPRPIGNSDSGRIGNIVLLCIRIGIHWRFIDRLVDRRSSAIIVFGYLIDIWMDEWNGGECDFWNCDRIIRQSNDNIFHEWIPGRIEFQCIDQDIERNADDRWNRHVELYRHGPRICQRDSDRGLVCIANRLVDFEPSVGIGYIHDAADGVLASIAIGHSIIGKSDNRLFVERISKRIDIFKLDQDFERHSHGNRQRNDDIYCICDRIYWRVSENKILDCGRSDVEFVVIG